MDVITLAIPVGLFYLGLFTLGMLVGALMARWVYRPGRVRVPYLRPPVPPEPGRGYQPEPRNAYNTNPPPDYPRPPPPPAPPPRAP